MAQEPIIRLYETISELSERMLDAARASDWALMDALERECAGHVAEIAPDWRTASLSWQDRAHKLRLVRQILACDREIRHLLDPWMTELAIRLNGPGRFAQLSSRA